VPEEGGLSGRFVRVPVEFTDRTLHPWMTLSTWRESYVRLQRNMTFQEHTRKIGARKYRLQEGDVCVSVPWLQEGCPELTDKSARLLLAALEEHGLISYPYGKHRGARMQVVRLAEPWRETRLVAKEGRTRRGRKRRSERRSGAQAASEGRTTAPPGASLDPVGANSGTQTGSETGSRGELEKGHNGSGARGFGFQRVAGGELQGGGDTEGEGESPPERATLSLPPRERLESLTTVAARYCAPDREGVVPLRGREKTALRQLIGDLWTSLGGEEPVRRWIVNARRWADDVAHAPRVNASFLRANSAAISSYDVSTRRAEAEQVALERERQRRAAQYERDELVSQWRRDVGARFDQLEAEVKDEYRSRATSAIDKPDVENEASGRFYQLAIREAAIDVFACDIGMPKPGG